MKQKILYGLILPAAFCPISASADFTLKFGERELLGAPIAILGGYIFQTCEGIPVQIPEGAELTYSSAKTCIIDASLSLLEAADDAENETVPSLVVEPSWTPPAPLVADPPCAGGGGTTPAPNYDNQPFEEIFAAIDFTMQGLATPSLGKDAAAIWVDTTQAQVAIAGLGANDQANDISIIVENDVAGALLAMVDQTAGDCEDPPSTTPVGCPSCINSLELFVANDDWRDQWWSGDSDALDEFYVGVSEAAGVSNDVGAIIADNYLLKYQFAEDFFSGSIPGIEPFEAFGE